MSDPIKLEGEDAKIQIGDTVYTSEDIANLKAGHDKNLERKQLIAQREQELEETRNKLSKLENKDFNFKKLRDMNEEEKNKLTEAEKALMAKQEELEEKQTEFQTTIEASNKNEALAVLVGDDADLRKKVLHNYDRISGQAITKEDINNKMREAYNMLGAQQANLGNPINAAMNFHGSGGGAGSASTKPSKVDSDLAKKLGITDEDLKNNNLTA